MKKTKIVIVTIAVISFAVMPFIYRAKKHKEQMPMTEKVTKIEVEKVKKHTFEKYLTVSAELHSTHEVAIIPKIASQVMIYAFKDQSPVLENTPIKKGEVFAVLDNQDLQLHVKRSESMVLSAQAMLDLAKIASNDKTKDKKRMENLFKQGAITQKQMEIAQIEEDRSRSSLAQAEAQLIQARANLELDQYRLSQSYISSPIDGVLAKKHISIGDMTSPQKPIATIVTMDKMKLLAGIPYEYLSELDQKDPQIDILYQNSKYPAKLSHIHPTVDPITRTITFEMEFDNLKISNNEYLFHPGMIVTANIYLKKKDNVLSAAKNSLLQMDGKHFVFLYENGQALRKEVSVGLEDASCVEILEGLSEDALLITEGKNKITQGSKVFCETADGEVR